MKKVIFDNAFEHCLVNLSTCLDCVGDKYQEDDSTSYKKLPPAAALPQDLKNQNLDKAENISDRICLADNDKSCTSSDFAFWGKTEKGKWPTTNYNGLIGLGAGLATG